MYSFYILKDTLFNTRMHEEKKVTRRYEREGGSIEPSSIFESIQPIDMKLGMSNKCPVYFQLSIVTWHLICFLPGFLNFQIFFIFKFKH